VSPRSRVGALAALFLTSSLLVACTDDGGGPEPGPTPSTGETSATGDEAQLTFGVFGSEDEVAGYDDMVQQFNGLSDAAQVQVVSWPDHEQAAAALDRDEALPDVFLISRRDLAEFQQEGEVQPVDELLDARGVDFGDGYSRDALRAFSLDNRLTCMPYGISPMVVYVNTELIDFARMRERGLQAPGSDEDEEPPRAWTFEQFTAAAEFATRPRRNTKGVSIESTLRGLAPFIVSGDGQIFDDDSDPTSLAFSDEGTRAALETTLRLLRNAQVTLSPEQLAQRSAVEWFERGKLGMVAGFRDLVPRLRQVQGLEFDVMPIPVIEGSGTIGDITGLCISSQSPHIPEAADFLAHAVSVDSVTRVARAGYLVPANVAVATSDDFLQPGRQPLNSRVFNTAVRDIYIPPLLADWDQLEEAIAPMLVELFTADILPPELIDEITTEIDETSRTILAPETVTESPTPSPSG
jgi:multiple sugar transport system substrate-binding protein